MQLHKSILKRIEALEKLYSVEPLVVLATADNGEEVTVTAREAVEKNMSFIKVVSGGNMHDLDLLLEQIKTEAFQESNY